MKVKSIAECSKGSILQYFGPALSDNWSWKTIIRSFCEWLFYTGFTVFSTVKSMKMQTNSEQASSYSVYAYAYKIWAVSFHTA